METIAIFVTGILAATVADRFVLVTPLRQTAIRLSPEINRIRIAARSVSDGFGSRANRRLKKTRR
jgi:hypothetical protein